MEQSVDTVLYRDLNGTFMGHGLFSKDNESILLENDVRFVFVSTVCVAPLSLRHACRTKPKYLFESAPNLINL